MDLLCFSVLCLLCICARLFICALCSPAGKGLTSWLSFVVYNCEFVTLQFVSLLIVSIPDLCTLTYFKSNMIISLLISAVLIAEFLERHMSEASERTPSIHLDIHCL